MPMSNSHTARTRSASLYNGAAIEHHGDWMFHDYKVLVKVGRTSNPAPTTGIRSARFDAATRKIAGLSCRADDTDILDSDDKDTVLDL